MRVSNSKIQHRRPFPMASLSEALALAAAHHRAGRLAAAEQIYRQILAAEPHQAEAWHMLGVVAGQAGRPEVAVECIGRALGLQPAEASFHNDLGEAYHGLRRLSEAQACYLRALELMPDYPAACNNLGGVFHDLGRLAEACACYRRALQLDPDYAEAHNSLGTALQEQGKFSEAAACYRRALELKPDYIAAHNNLGAALVDQGQPEEAAACYRRALQLKPDLAGVHSNLLSALQRQAGITPAELAEAHAAFDRAHARPLQRAWPRHANPRDAQRRLRVGFVSPDLHRHPVGLFLIGCLENLDGREVEAVCYSDRIARAITPAIAPALVEDDITRRFQAAAAQWRDVYGLGDEALAQQIGSDRIDILFDLTGHTPPNRLLVFARKPAPLQITWLGYEGTTGLSAMDYLLADRYEIPPGGETHYRENVLRMPDGYVCYDPPREAPPVAPLPAREPGQVTFGSFSNLGKITPAVVKVWAEILRRLPKSRLVLKYRGLNDEAVRQRFCELFAQGGVEPGRLALRPPSSYGDYLAAYREIDLALDPFPFSGSATTCDALWMGVPVVTCPGETFASRHSLSHLWSVGLTETIAGDLPAYVEIAVGLAHDLPRLAAIRARLRGQMAASPLCDGRRFAVNFTALLRDVWRRWCGRERMRVEG